MAQIGRVPGGADVVHFIDVIDSDAAGWLASPPLERAIGPRTKLSASLRSAIS